MLVALGAVAVGTAWGPVPAASAANTPTYRDCSLVGGVDPDYVALSGATVDSAGNATVTQAQDQVTIKASESSDPGDDLGHDTFTVTVSAPNVPARTLSGMGTGNVTLSVPLAGAAVGSAYTITWQAVFDSGEHPCPSSMTPKNTTANPFVLDVVANGPATTLLSVAGVHESHRVWREPNTPAMRKRPVGTTFSFGLNEQAGVRLDFMQRLGGRKVDGRCVAQTKQNRKRPACNRVLTRGALSIAGQTGPNHVTFDGRLSAARRLKPGRYTLVVTSTDAAGQRSQPRSVSFTIVR
jgi:hypothetical protein